MVGDSVEDDIEGATALGMRAFLIDREGRHPEGVESLPDLREPAGRARALEAELGAPGVGVLAEAGAGAGRLEAELRRGLLDRPHRPGADVLAVHQLEPLGQRPARRSPRRARAATASWSGSNCRSRQVGPADDLAEPLPELRLERADRQPAAVGGGVDPVAGEAAGQQPPGGPLRAGARRGGASRASSRRRAGRRGPCARARAGRRRPPAPPTSAAGGEVGDLRRRHRRRGVGEHAGPAEVVDVVAGAALVAVAGAEAGDRAEDGACRATADAEPRRHAGPEARRGRRPPARRAPFASAEPFLGLQVADDRLLAGVDRRRATPGRSRASDRRPGGSTRTTRAPRRSSSRDANGPGRYQVKSTTSMPVRAAAPHDLHYGRALD